MKSKWFALLVALFPFVSTLGATEVRVVRFLVQPEVGPPPCQPVVAWSSQTFFHNSTDADQTVRFLGVSNGAARPNPKPLTVPPHQTVLVGGFTFSVLDWEPLPGTTLWVDRLDVPQGVIVANRVASGVTDVSLDASGQTCIPSQTGYAGLPLPVFGALTPAGTTQYFLGTDVGSDAQRTADSRLNVGVYNGGTAAAVATVKVYCGHTGLTTDLPNSLVSTEQIQIPADSIIQRAVLASTQRSSCPYEGFWYASVTVDQPSFAYGIGLTNGTLPRFPRAVALTYTGN